MFINSRYIGKFGTLTNAFALCIIPRGGSVNMIKEHKRIFRGVILAFLITASSTQMSKAATVTTPSRMPSSPVNGNVLVWNTKSAKPTGVLNINTQMEPAVPRFHGGNVIYVYLTDRRGLAVDNANVYARIIGRGSQRNLSLRSRGHGIYASDLVFPKPGKWHVAVIAHTRAGIKMASIKLHVSSES